LTAILTVFYLVLNLILNKEAQKINKSIEFAHLDKKIKEK
jgi:hypothetical protein